MHEIASGKWYSGVDVGEALRYAGVRSAESCPDEMAADAARAVNQVGEAALCKAISRECSLTVSDGICVIDGMEIRSDSLAEHLAGCDRALLFAATLGSGVDLLISRYSTVPLSSFTVTASAPCSKKNTLRQAAAFCRDSVRDTATFRLNARTF